MLRHSWRLPCFIKQQTEVKIFCHILSDTTSINSQFTLHKLARVRPRFASDLPLQIDLTQIHFRLDSAMVWRWVRPGANLGYLLCKLNLWRTRVCTIQQTYAMQSRNVNNVGKESARLPRVRLVSKSALLRSLFSLSRSSHHCLSIPLPSIVQCYNYIFTIEQNCICDSMMPLDIKLLQNLLNGTKL